MQPCSHTRRPRDRAVVCDENPLFNLVRLQAMVQFGGFVCVGTHNDPLALSRLLGSVQRRVWAYGVPKSCFQADAVTLWVFDEGGCYRSSPNTKPRILALGSLVGPRLAVFGFGLVVVTRSHSRPVGKLSTCGRRGEGFLRPVIKGISRWDPIVVYLIFAPTKTEEGGNQPPAVRGGTPLVGPRVER